MFSSADLFLYGKFRFNSFIYLLEGIGATPSDPADLFGGKTPDRAFWNAQIHATSANTDHL
jgi:hypothetical protein